MPHKHLKLTHMLAEAITDRNGAGDTIVAWGTGTPCGAVVCTIPPHTTCASIFTG